jgi:hypothetical protein
LAGGAAVKEADIITLLRRRYGQHYTGNGGNPRYVCASHVRDRLWAARTADFLAMECSEMHGNAIHGHEIKCSRSDWLRELGQPEKAEAFRRYCDYWWLVAAERSVVADLSELPDGWGLLYVRGSRLVGARPPTRNADVQPMPRGMIASFIRRSQARCRCGD